MNVKVRALNHLTQTVGCLSVERVFTTVFEVDEATAVAAIAAGIVEAIGKAPELSARNRSTKVEKKMEKK